MLKKSILSRSLLLALSTLSVGVGITPTAIAQSTTVGSIYGKVSAQRGDTVSLENRAIGLKRTAPVDASGAFKLVALPPGKYTATLSKDGTPVSSVELTVLAGQGTAALLDGASTAQQLEAVVVTGRSKTIDVSSSENGSTFTAIQLAALPVASKDLNGIIALSSNTVKADPRYAGGASIGGGAPSENAYYINGFPVTNALTQLGSIELPYGAIGQADVKTGGFGAEFGRSVGGVVNISTKSGTNELQGGAAISLEPNALRSKSRNLYYANTGASSNAKTDDTIYFDRSNNSQSETTLSGYLGGALIKDNLFFFLALDQTKTKRSYVYSTPQGSTRTTSGWVDSTDTNDRYLGKLDWFITDNHQVEVTLLGDNYKTTLANSGYDYTTGKPTGYVYSEYAKNAGNTTPAVGGDAQIIKYTGNITDKFTVTALYGQSESKHEDRYSFAPTDPTYGWNSTGRSPDLIYLDPAKSKNPLPDQSTGIKAGAKDTTKSFRLDAEYRLGSHTIRAGLDENRLKSVNAGEAVIGGHSWLYRSTSNANLNLGYGPITNFAKPATNGRYYYTIDYIFDDTTNAESNQSAQYIEDRWKITKNLLVTGGLRNERFVNKNGDGETFLESKNFVSPRLAAAWDVNGDSSLKVYGTAGRYSLQIPTHVAVRGASRSLYTTQYFAYTGIDPATGLPTGKTALSDAISTNNEYGQPKDVPSVAARNIKPTYQDEITLGIEKALNPSLIAGAKVTYRTLKATIDDLCDNRPFQAYADANNIDTSNWAGMPCSSFNPGQGNTFLVDYTGGKGTYTTVALSAADMGFEKAKRTYTAVDLFLEHPLRDGWFGRVTYTWSQSKGNTEGQTKSDNAQTDVAATSTWDLPELMKGAYGNLPNDRTHQIKAYGYYQLNSEWILGGNALLESGRPKNCFGNDLGAKAPQDSYYYGDVFFYCGGQATPRGSQGRLPWQYSLDLNAAYKPSFVKGLTLRADVFNLLNSQTAALFDETAETSRDPSTVPAIYGRVRNYTTPRYFRLSAEYNF